MLNVVQEHTYVHVGIAISGGAVQRGILSIAKSSDVKWKTTNVLELVKRSGSGIVGRE